MSQIDNYVRPQKVCLCKGVSRENIENAIKNGADSLEKIAEVTLATTGCGTCKKKIEVILKEKHQIIHK